MYRCQRLGFTEPYPPWELHRACQRLYLHTIFLNPQTILRERSSSPHHVPFPISEAAIQPLQPESPF